MARSPEPVGVRTPMSVGRRGGKVSPNATYVIVVCKDEEGRLFYFEASTFNCQMKPLDDKSGPSS